MSNKEKEFIERSILNLLVENKTSNIKTIVDYLDFINKVVYKEEEITSVLNKLILENKIKKDNDIYLLV